MKKLFTLICMALMAIGANASELVEDFKPNTYSFNGGWGGKWWDLSTGDVQMDKDLTQFDYVWIKFSGNTSKFAFGIIYAEWLKTETWGEVYYTEQKTIDTEAGVVGIALEKTKVLEFGINKADNEFKGDVYAKHARQVFVQDQGAPVEVQIDGIWFGTVDEYEAALAGNQPVLPDTKDFSLDNLGSGWGDSTYDKDTKTITIGENWSGKGIWLGDVDYSHYAYIVVEFAAPTETNGNVVIECEGGNNGADKSFNVGCLQKVSKLPEQKDHLKQIYIQGPAGAKYVLQRIYAATEEYATANALTDQYEKLKKEDLSLASLGSGWSSEYNADTKTITITGDEEGNGGGRGWWFGSDNASAKDASDFDNAVVELEATATGGKLVVEYVGAESTEVEFYPGATCIVAALDATAKSAVKQIYFTGNKGVTFTLTAAYLALSSETPAAQLGTPSGIATVQQGQRTTANMFNMAGQRVAEGYKGIVVVNGRKVAVK